MGEISGVRTKQYRCCLSEHLRPKEQTDLLRRARAYLCYTTSSRSLERIYPVLPNPKPNMLWTHGHRNQQLVHQRVARKERLFCSLKFGRGWLVGFFVCAYLLVCSGCVFA